MIKVICRDNADNRNYLTINKVYNAETISISTPCYKIIDDSGESHAYFKFRFELLAEWRDKQIENIFDEIEVI